MSFRPTINATIAISTQEYIFQEHPAAKGMVYGQSGKRATVYQLRNLQGELFALKVFIPAFRTPETEQSAVKLATFADLPGLQVCTRLVLSEKNNLQLLQKVPELTYAVLMPWVQGHTWYDILSTRKSFEQNQSITTARAFVNMLSTMERNGLAHCDLSSANVLVYNFVQEGFPLLALVDLEDMFGPGFDQPSALPGGTSGYGHRTSKQGQWNAFSDRFAGAVLLAEMLCWFDPNIRQAAEGEQFFSQTEMQTNSPRYSMMLKVLETRWGNEVAGLFLKAWESQTLDQCPAFSEWAGALSRAEQYFVATFRNPTPASASVLVPPYSGQPVSGVSPRKLVVSDDDANTLLAQAQQHELAGHYQDALQFYRLAERKSSDKDLGAKINELESRLAASVNSTEQAVLASSSHSGFQSPPNPIPQAASVPPKPPSSVTGSYGNPGLDLPPQKPKIFLILFGLAIVGLFLLCVGVGVGVFAPGILWPASASTGQPIVVVITSTSSPNTLDPTASQTDTLAPSVAAADTSNPTSTAETINLDFCSNSSEDICVYSLGNAPPDQMLVTLQIQGQFPTNIYMKTSSGKSYSCRQLSDFPGRLYCTGPIVKESKEVTFYVYATSNDQMLATGGIYVPDLNPAPTSKPNHGGSYP